MDEKNIEFEKELNRKYGKVQIEENKFKEHLVKKEKKFLGDTKKISTEYKKDLKTHADFDKEITNKFKDSLKVIKENHLNLLKDIQKRISGLEKDNKKALEVATKEYEGETTRLNELLVTLNSDLEKLNEDVLKAYNKDLSKSEARKVSLVEQSVMDINNLLTQLKEAQENYEILVSKLNEKRDEKQEKLQASNVKKIDKIQIEIEKEESKIAKSINDLKLPYEEKLAVIEEKIKVENDKFTTKDSAIKSTLESKVARHEKFMNKSMRDNDSRAVKQHKKEIAVLEKNAEKELKLLSKEHDERFEVLKDKKNELMTSNLNKIASFESDLVKSKEEKLYQIDLNKATLNNDIEMSTLSAKQTLEDELNKYNVYYSENERSQSEVKYNEELALEKEKDYQVHLKLTFDETNKVNVVKHQEALASRDKELKLSEFVLNSEHVLSNLGHEAELSKLKNEKEVSEKELILTIQTNNKNEYIEYHKNESNKFASNSNEFYNYQNEVTSLLKDRAIVVSSYETIELNNRVNLKVAFLEKQLVLLEKDCSRIIEKTNEFFENEKAVFEVEINKLSKGALADLSKFEDKSNEEIKALIDKKNALDPKAYKKEIRVFDKEITSKNRMLDEELSKRKEIISQNSRLFTQGLEEAVNRKENALKDINEFNSIEKEKLDKAIELVKTGLNGETHNIVGRLNTTVSQSADYAESLLVRKNLVTEQNVEYLEGRINKEQDSIEHSKSLFEQEKSVLTSALEQYLLENGNKKSAEISNTTEQKLKEETNLESIIADFESLANKYVKEKEDLAENQSSTLQSNIAKIDQRHSNKLVQISKQLNEKVSNYNMNTVDLDGAKDEEIRKFDSDKKIVQRKYETSLSKEMLIISQKLQTDIKNI